MNKLLNILASVFLVLLFVIFLPSSASAQTVKVEQNCRGKCAVTLDKNLADGSYRLTGFVTKKGETKVLFEDIVLFDVKGKKRDCSDKCYLKVPPYFNSGSYILTAALTKADTGQVISKSVLALEVSGAKLLSHQDFNPQCDPNSGDKNCTSAKGEECEDKTLKTAIGCINTEPGKLVSGLVKVATAAGGAIALLLMILGSLKMILSGGSPDRLKEGREQFTSAVIGLLFIIFSVLLLQVIGVDILNIPGFS